MERMLLKTKLYIPKPRYGVIERTRLLTRLNEGINNGKQLSLISAPAGYGKTTLVANWIVCVDRAQAWLSLDEQDNDPVRFFSYLIEALKTIDPNIGIEAARLLTSTSMLAVQAVVATLIN